MNRATLTGLCLLLLAASAPGDVITKKDGTRLTGKVTQEDADSVTLQSNFEELITRSKIARKDIADIQKEARPDATFCRIPIEGEIGTAVKAEYLAKALAQARSLKTDYIILYFDSGGGHVSEMVKIIDLLKENKDLHLIAHVKTAGSAAAIIAMTCPTIILTPDGSIGAAVPFRFGPDGIPQDVEAKYRSYYESVSRGAAEIGGHSPLLVRGMMEMDMALSIVTLNGRSQVVEGEFAKGTIIKKANQILTLQGREAVNAGLAAGLADDLVDSPSLVGLKSWTSAGDTPWAYMKSRQNALSDANSQIATLRTEQATKIAQANGASDTIKKLNEDWKRDVHQIDEQYTRATSVNRLPSEIEIATAKAREARETQIAALKSKYQALYDVQKRLHDDAVERIENINAKLQQLQAQTTSH